LTPRDGGGGGISPPWFSYISGEDTDATASRAHELGGTVYGEAFNVMEFGWMAAIQDSTGAILAA
jgi:predicted enzyme related to lactoylglutathione lyase